MAKCLRFEICSSYTDLTRQDPVRGVKPEPAEPLLPHQTTQSRPKSIAPLLDHTHIHPSTLKPTHIPAQYLHPDIPVRKIPIKLSARNILSPHQHTHSDHPNSVQYPHSFLSSILPHCHTYLSTTVTAFNNIHTLINLKLTLSLMYSAILSTQIHSISPPSQSALLQKYSTFINNQKHYSRATHIHPHSASILSFLITYTQSVHPPHM